MRDGLVEKNRRNQVCKGPKERELEKRIGKGGVEASLGQVRNLRQ